MVVQNLNPKTYGTTIKGIGERELHNDIKERENIHL